MIVDLLTYPNWVDKTKIGNELRIIEFTNPEFFLKQFTGTGPEDAEKFRQLKEALEEVTSTFSFIFMIQYDAKASPHAKWSISARGNFLDVLQNFLYEGNIQKNLKLVLKESGTYKNEAGLKIERVIAAELQRDEFLDHLNPDFFMRHYCYSHNDISEPAVNQALDRDIEWTLTLQLILDE